MMRSLHRTVGLGIPPAMATIIDRLLSFRKQWAGRSFDRRLGVETNEKVSRRDLTEMPAEARKHAGEYSPTNPDLFRRIIKESGVDPSCFAFVDLGCGKGRVVIAAAQYPFRAITGVEADLALCRVAKQNVKRCAIGHSNERVDIVHSDAREFRWPNGSLFIFMYDPFGGPVFHQVADRLATLASEPGRAIVIAYSADREAEVLERAGCFTRVRLPRKQFWAASTVSFFYNDAAMRMRHEQTSKFNRSRQ